MLVYHCVTSYQILKLITVLIFSLFTKAKPRASQSSNSVEREIEITRREIGSLPLLLVVSCFFFVVVGKDCA